MANIDKLRAHISGMMGSGMKNSPSAKSRVKSKMKTTRMKSKAQKSSY